MGRRAGEEGERHLANREFAFGAVPGVERARVYTAITTCPESDHHVAAESTRSAPIIRNPSACRERRNENSRNFFFRWLNRRCDFIVEGQLPKGAAYLEESVSADNRSLSNERPLISPGEISKYRTLVS